MVAVALLNKQQPLQLRNRYRTVGRSCVNCINCPPMKRARVVLLIVLYFNSSFARYYSMRNKILSLVLHHQSHSAFLWLFVHPECAHTTHLGPPFHAQTHTHPLAAVSFPFTLSTLTRSKYISPSHLQAQRGCDGSHLHPRLHQVQRLEQERGAGCAGRPGHEG